MPKPLVVFHFEDNNGKRAEHRYVFNASAIDPATGGAGVNTLRDALVSLSDARLTHYEIIFSSGDIGGPPPAPTSDCLRRLSLLYRNGDEWGAVLFPSPVALPDDGLDTYGHSRFTRAEAILSGVLADLERLVANQVKSDGSPFPDTFIVGSPAGGLPL